VGLSVDEGALSGGAPAAPRNAGEPLRPHASREGWLGRLWKNERGTAVVEFAVIAPVLFMLVFGLVDFARGLAYYNDLTQLSGQGARAAAVNRNPDGTVPTARSIQTQLVANAAQGELRSRMVACITHAPGAALPDYVRVKTSYHFNLIGVGGLLKIAAIDLSSTSTMLAEALPKDSGGNPTYVQGAQTAGLDGQC
jgi:Flp pilus assembly protein TadG